MKTWINMSKKEQKRYNAIKKSNEYLEFNILIGKEKTKYDDEEGVIPVVTSNMHNCSYKEIAYLHASLKIMVEQLEQDYPLMCLYSIENIDGEYKHKETIKTVHKKED